MIDLRQGDCLEVMKELPNESIDCIITSPPYDNLRTYNNNDIWDFEKFKLIANELFRVLKKGGVIVWVVGDQTINGSESGTSFKQALYFKEIGFNIHDTMIWNKGGCPFPDKTRYYQSFEYMFIFTKGKIKTFNPIVDRINKWANSKIHGTSRQQDGTLKKPSGMKVGRLVKEKGVRFNLWGISPERNNKTNHPAPFPLQLALDHIISWTNENDVVLDCFMGSGTTGVACIELNRNFIGIELDSGYFEIAKKRIEETQNKPLNLFDILDKEVSNND